MNWARILAYVTGTVDQELLARAEYLVAENRILKAQLTGQLKLSDADCQSASKFDPPCCRI
jgi:putative transposase